MYFSFRRILLMVLVHHFVLPAPVRMPSASRPFAIRSIAVALQVFPVDAFYHLCLFWIDDEIAICILGVAEEVIVIYLYLAILVSKLESKLHILAEGSVISCCAREAIIVIRTSPLASIVLMDSFSKKTGNVLILQLTDVFQAIQRVSGKSADGLGDNHVDVSGIAVVNHTVKVLTLFCVGAGNTIIGVDTGKFPFRVFLYKFCIMLDLSIVACSLFIAVSTDSAIRRDAKPWLCILLSGMLFPTCLFAGMTITFPII